MNIPSRALPAVVPEGFGTAIPSNPTELLKFLKQQKQKNNALANSSKITGAGHEVNISMDRLKKQDIEREMFETRQMQIEDNFQHRQAKFELMKSLEENITMETEDALSSQLESLFKEYDQERLKAQILKDVEKRKAQELTEREEKRKANEARRAAVLERIRRQQAEEERRKREAEEAAKQIAEGKLRQIQQAQERLLHDQATMSTEDQLSGLVEQEYREFLERKKWQEREKVKLLQWEAEQKRKDVMEAELRAKRMVELEEKKKKLEALKRQQQAAAATNDSSTTNATSNTAQQMKEQGDRLNKQLRIQNRAKFVSKRISNNNKANAANDEHVMNVNDNQQLDQVLELNNSTTTATESVKLIEEDEFDSTAKLSRAFSARNLTLQRGGTMKLNGNATMRSLDDAIFGGTTTTSANGLSSANASGLNILDQSNHDMRTQLGSTGNLLAGIELHEQEIITKHLEQFQQILLSLNTEAELIALQKELMLQKRSLRLEQHGRPVHHHHAHRNNKANQENEQQVENELSMKSKVYELSEKLKLLEIRLAKIVSENQSKSMAMMGTTTTTTTTATGGAGASTSTNIDQVAMTTTLKNAVDNSSTDEMNSVSTQNNNNNNNNQEELFKQIEMVIRQSNKLLAIDFTDMDDLVLPEDNDTAADNTTTIIVTNNGLNCKQIARDATFYSMEIQQFFKSLSKEFDPLGYHEKLINISKRLVIFLQELPSQEEAYELHKHEKLKQLQAMKELKKLEVMKLHQMEQEMKMKTQQQHNKKEEELIPTPRKQVQALTKQPSIPKLSTTAATSSSEMLPQIKSARTIPDSSQSLPASSRKKSLDKLDIVLPLIEKNNFMSSVSVPTLPSEKHDAINIAKHSPRLLSTPKLTPRCSPRLLLPEIPKKSSSKIMTTMMMEPSEESKSIHSDEIIIAADLFHAKTTKKDDDEAEEESSAEEKQEQQQAEQEEEEINPETLPGWEECIYSSMFSAAHAAAFFGYLEVLQFLVKYFDCFIMDKKGRTPLFYASMANRLDCVALLLGLDPQWIDVGDEKGDTPLHAAAISNGIQVLAFLLSCEANPDTANHAGLTPSHLARTKDTLILLHDSNAQMYCVDNLSRIPLWYACFEGKIDCIDYLCQHTPSEFILWKDTTPDGDSCLHATCKQGHAQCIDILAQYLPNLLDDLVIANSKKHTPAHVASNAAVLKTLYENGANLWLLDEKGRMPLFIASFFGRTDCVAFLIELGMQKPRIHAQSSILSVVSIGSNSNISTADTPRCTNTNNTNNTHSNFEEGVYHKDKQGDNALHVACLCGHITCVNLLLYYLSNEANHQQLRPSDLARKANHLQIAKLVETIQSYKDQGYSIQEIFRCEFNTLYLTITYYGSRWIKQYDSHFQAMYYVDRIVNISQWERPEEFDMSEKDEKQYDAACDLLVKFYSQYNPEKLSDMNNILWMYRGRYTELFISLANKYNLQDLSMFSGVHLD